MAHPRLEHDYPSDTDSSDELYEPSQADINARQRERDGYYIGSDSEVGDNYNYSSEEEYQIEVDEPDLLGAEGGQDPNAQVFDFHGFQHVPPAQDPNCPPNPPFTGIPVGHVRDISELTEREMFEIFVDLPFAQHIVGCTNAKAEYFIPAEAAKRGIRVDRIKFNGAKWYPLTVPEFYVYLALSFKMGITKEPKVSDYWSIHPIWGGHQDFRTAMTRSRYYNITKFLRCSLQTSPTQKFTHQERIEHAFNLLNDRCQANLHPGQHLRIDEALVLWKGNLCFRQFIKLKRSRFGINFFFYAREILLGKDTPGALECILVATLTSK